jgi:hypothetical protein
MEVTLSGIVTAFKTVQLAKDLPIVVSLLSGLKVKLTRLPQYMKAKSAIERTFLPM